MYLELKIKILSLVWVTTYTLPNHFDAGASVSMAGRVISWGEIEGEKTLAR